MVGKGIYIRGYSLRDYTHEIDESNTVNGKPVYYWKEVEGGRIPDGAGQVILVNCTNITIKNQNLNNASVGMEVAYSSFITIKNNTCSNNNIGIYLVHSNKNRISNNNFINNTVGPSVSTNAWNSTEEITYIYRGTTYTNYLGNYWYDYEGTDADGDGIGDTPYIMRYSIRSIEKDNYPLMQPWQNYSLGENDSINNTNNVYSYDSNNIWNSTEKITYIYNDSQCTNYIGNYWGGYNGKYPAAEETDSTGIWWDTPHGINSDKDYYPLMDRAENYFVSTENFFRAGNVICNCGKN